MKIRVKMGWYKLTFTQSGVKSKRIQSILILMGRKSCQSPSKDDLNWFVEPFPQFSSDFKLQGQFFAQNLKPDFSSFMKNCSISSRLVVKLPANFVVFRLYHKTNVITPFKLWDWLSRQSKFILSDSLFVVSRRASLQTLRGRGGC